MTRFTTDHTRTGEQSLGFSRRFAAPAERVFRAHTRADLFVQWMGPLGTRVEAERFDARTGGAFDYTVVGSGRWRFFGSYHEVAAPHRIVHTWEFAEDPGRPTLEILTFTDLGDGTSRLDGRSLFPTEEACAEMFASDLQAGMDGNFDRLDDVLASDLG